MTGYKLKSGGLNKSPMGELEIWQLINYFFSSQSKKSTTYKYALLRAILDETFNLSPPNYEVTFKTIFEKFSEIYWNLSVKEQIRQSTDKTAIIDSILNNYAKKNTPTLFIPFKKLPIHDKEKLIKEITLKGKNNVFGALYTDFNGKLFGFDKTASIINIHPDVVLFLKKFKVNINRLNNYEWIKWMESNSKIITHKNYIDALENSIERGSLRGQMNSLKGEKYLPFKCFYCTNTPTTLDHIIPWSFISHDKIWNLVYCCKGCNGRKNARLCDRKVFKSILLRNLDLIKNKYDFNNELLSYSEPDYIELFDYAEQNGIKIW